MRVAHTSPLLPQGLCRRSRGASSGTQHDPHPSTGSRHPGSPGRVSGVWVTVQPPGNHVCVPAPVLLNAVFQMDAGPPTCTSPAACRSQSARLCSLGQQLRAHEQSSASNKGHRDVHGSWETDWTQHQSAGHVCRSESLRNTQECARGLLKSPWGQNCWPTSQVSVVSRNSAWLCPVPRCHLCQQRPDANSSRQGCTDPVLPLGNSWYQ